MARVAEAAQHAWAFMGVLRHWSTWGFKHHYKHGSRVTQRGSESIEECGAWQHGHCAQVGILPPTLRACVACVQVLGQLISSLFDLNPTMATHLKESLWKKCVLNLLDMVKILQENPNIVVSGPELDDG